MKRVFDPESPELMDRPEAVTAELDAALRNLASINRWFGGQRLVRKFLSRWLDAQRTWRVLDLATGYGDIPRAIIRWARGRGISVKVEAVDFIPATLDIARRESSDFPEIEFIRADALNFESRETYDLVHCSLALHHFSEEDAILLLRRCSALSHRFVLVSDLERSAMALAGARALSSLIYRTPMTRADAIASARGAFSFDEFRGLAESAGWTDFGHARFLFCRQALWLDFEAVGDIPLTEVVPCPT